MALNTQDLLDLKDVIEESYTDGISAIISAEMNGEAITGVFRDGVKQYEFNVNPDDPNPERQLSYKLLNPEVIKSDRIDEDPMWLYRSDRIDDGDLVTYFEVGVRVDAKKNCTKGTACGGSCIPATKTCRKKEGLSDQGKAKAKKVKEKLKKEPAAKSAKPKKEVATKAEPKAKTPKVKAENAAGAAKSNEIKPEKLLSKNLLGEYRVKASDEDYDKLIELSDGASMAKDAKQSRIFDASQAYKSEERAMQEAEKNAALYNQLANPPKPDGSTGKAARFAQGEKIKSQQDFESTFDEVFKSLDEEFNMNGLVPIYRIRRSMGDRLTRGQFDRFMLKLQDDDKAMFLEGSVEDSSPDKIYDSMQTRMGKLRGYAKRTS